VIVPFFLLHVSSFSRFRSFLRFRFISFTSCCILIIYHHQMLIVSSQ
jgi:hypothetical protein